MSAPRVDFYLLNTDEPQAKWLFACRLLEKAYLRGHQIFVYCNDEHQAENLDELLWTFKEDSFIPHNLQGEGPEPPPAIQIGHGQEPRGFREILLNLADTVPPFYMRFRRVIEIVTCDDAAKNLSRIHYREYRAQACALQTHTIEGS